MMMILKIVMMICILLPNKWKNYVDYDDDDDDNVVDDVVADMQHNIRNCLWLLESTAGQAGSIFMMMTMRMITIRFPTCYGKWLSSQLGNLTSDYSSHNINTDLKIWWENETIDKVGLGNLANDAQLPRKGNKCFTFNMRVCSCFGPQLTIDFWKYSQDNLKCGKCWITRIFDEPKIYLRPRGSAPGFTRPLCLNCWEAVKGARLPVSGHKDEPLHGCYPTNFFFGKKIT